MSDKSDSSDKSESGAEVLFIGELSQFRSPALTPEEAEPRERKGRPGGLPPEEMTQDDEQEHEAQ